MLKWYTQYCVVAFIVGIVVGYLIGEWLVVHEYILVPGHVVPAPQPLTT